MSFHKEKEIHLPTTFLRLFKKDATFYHLQLFLDPVIRLIICLAICPVVHQVIWCFTVDSESSFVDLSNGSLQCEFIRSFHFSNVFCHVVELATTDM